MDMVSDGAFIFDEHKTILLCNQTFLNLIGKSREKILNENASDYIKNIPDPVFLNAAHGAITSDENGQLCQIKMSEDRQLAARVMFMAFPQGGRNLYLCLIHSEQLHQESSNRLAHAHKMEAIGQLTSTMAHNFNNLLSIVLGGVHKLQRKVGPYINDLPTQKLFWEYTEMIESASLRGKNQIDRLMLFARTRQDYENLTKTDLQTFFEELKTLLTLAVKNTIQVDVLIEDQLPLVYLDPEQFESMIVNLAVNASDAMPNGGRLTFEAHSAILDENYEFISPDVKPGRYVQISVSDTGSGIEPDIINKIFDPFFTTKQAGKGTGLGLSMVYGCVKQMGGHIHVYSELGHGTVFKIYLPISIEEKLSTSKSVGVNMEAQNENMKAASRALDLKEKTVLVVDNTSLLREMSGRAFKRLGMEVKCAVNGEEALALCSEASKPFDIIFMDLFLDDENGWELIPHLQEKTPNAKVLYTSGYNLKDVEDQISVSAESFIGKPFSLPELKSKLIRLLS